MKTYKIVLALLVITQVLSNTRFGLDVNNARAYLNGGDGYIFPGISYQATDDGEEFTAKYYSLPSGWTQFNSYFVVPNLLAQRGNWIIGMRTTGNGQSFNDQIRVTINGLAISLASLSGLGTTNLVIGNNFRSQEVSDDDWNTFLQTLGQDSVFNANSISNTVELSGDDVWVENLIRGDDEQYYEDEVMGIIISQTPAMNQNTRVNDQQRRRALQRQIRANRALGELQNLIKQLSQNVQSARGSISKFQAQLERVRTTSTQCNDRILQFSNAKVSSQTAVQQLTNQINQSQAKLKDLNSAFTALNQKRDSLVEQRNRIQKNKTPNSNQLSQIQQRFTSCNSEATKFRTQYQGVVTNIQKISERISNAKNNAADAPRQLSLVNQQITGIDRNIADLEAQIRQAKSKKTKLQGDKVRYSNLVQSSKNQVTKLQNESSGLKNRLNDLKSRVDKQVVQCSTFKSQGDKIREQIAGNQKQYQQIVRQIQTQEGLVGGKQNQINKLKADISAYTTKRGPLETTLANAKVALQRQYSICSQSTSSVQKAQSLLQTSNLKLQTQQKFLSDAQSKLSAAQQQKTDADSAVDQISSNTQNIRSDDDSDQETSVTYILRRTPVQVTYPDYFTQTYGRGIMRYLNEYVNGRSIGVMYPISRTTWGALTGQNSAGVFVPGDGQYILGEDGGLGDFVCSAQQTVSGYGKILSVQPGYIIIRNPNNSIVRLRIGNCSRLESNRAQFVASVMDGVFYRGYYDEEDGDLYVYDLSCLS